jgi:hypothetical protein
MSKIIVGLVLLSLMACTGITKITDPQGEIWEIEHGTDAVVEYKHENVYIKTDNTGGRGFFNDLLLMIGVKTFDDTDLNTNE